ncbi:MAG: hypothetical protein ACHQRM_03415 [Bacteroidia bacterium]
MNKFIFYKNLRTSFLSLLFICSGTLTQAQHKVAMSVSDFTSISEQCLQQAQDLFNNGAYDSCIVVLSKGIQQSFFDRKGKEDMLILKTKAYLEKDELENAELTLKGMIRHNPYYELNESQNTEDFNRLYNRFDIHDKLILGVRNALLVPTLPTTNVYSAKSGYNYADPYVTSKYILMYYGWAEYQFRDNTSANMEAVYWSLGYSRNMNMTNTTNFKISEQMHLIEIPVFERFYMPHNLNIPFLKNILSYAALGIGYLRMQDATANVNETILNPATGYLSSFRYANGVNMMPMRTTNNFEWIYGIGIGYKVKRLRMYLDLRGYAPMNTLTNPGERTGNSNLYTNYSYVDNGIKLRKSELGASISYTLSNSVKKKKIKKESRHDGSKAQFNLNSPD